MWTANNIYLELYYTKFSRGHHKSQIMSMYEVFSCELRVKTVIE